MSQLRSDRRQVIADLAEHVKSKLPLLAPVEKCWQPSDFVPDLTKENWAEEVKEFRKAALQLSDEILVILTGSMITEEALPSYQTSLNRLEGIKDETGASMDPWSQWSRGWTAEENRHGDLLNRYLYLTGRVDMRAIEVTIQHLIRNGFDPGHDSDPYNGLIYTSFQERATRLSHGKIGQLARHAGESSLAKICAIISGDEARHEDAYKSFMGRVFEIDPAGAVQALDVMLAHTIIMPANRMSDGVSNNLFVRFSVVAQRLGVYTFNDYIEIIEHLLQTWNIASLKGLTGDAAEAQDRVCRLPASYNRRSELMTRKLGSQPKSAFHWIRDRQA